MNAKQAAPLAATIAAVAPELFVIGVAGYGIYLALDWLLSDDEEKKPEAPPVPAAPERPALPVPSVSAGNPVQKSAVPSNSGRNTVEKRSIPSNSAGNSTVTPAPVPAMSVPVAPKIPTPPPSIIPVVKIQPEIPLPAQKKFISREDMAEIFGGGRRLTRKSAVAALKALGFGKSAAYEALATNGRFALWLQFASDGIITWKSLS